MKPTRNQLLAACGYHERSELGHRITPYNPSELTIDFFKLVADVDEEYDFDSRVVFAHQVFQKLTAFEEWRVHVEIKAQSDSCLPKEVWRQLQVPIEYLYEMDKMLALAWCSNEKHPCVLVPHAGAPNLLVQAINAKLVINTYYNTGRRSEPQWNDDGSLLRPSEDIYALEKGSVLLAFELAGITAPVDYDTWREPDGINVPVKAYLPHSPTWGNVTVHYTNGELALVTSGDGLRAGLLHTSKMESTAIKELSELTKRNRESKAPPKTEKVTDAMVKELASKWFTPKTEAKK